MAKTVPVGQIFHEVIPAGKSKQFNADGTNCYLLAASASVNIRGRTKTGNQAYSTYSAGTGFKDTEFTSVDVLNPNSFSVTVSVWIGTSAIDDHRLITAARKPL